MKGKNIKDVGFQLQKNPQKVEKERRKEGKIIQLIVFNLGDEEYGASIDQVREIIRTRVDYMRGVLTIENRLIIMLDLQNVLSEEELAKLSEIRIKHRKIIEKVKEKDVKAKEVKEEVKK